MLLPISDKFHILTRGLGAGIRKASAAAAMMLAFNACSGDAQPAQEAQQPEVPEVPEVPQVPQVPQVPATPAACDVSRIAEGGCDRALSLLLPEQLPPARGNRYAELESAAQLGFKLFFDSRLGSGVSCATCHLPELAFTDRKAVSAGKQVGNRNAPTIFNAGRLNVMFWDGRADSLWSQPLFAIESPAEMASTRLKLAHDIANAAELRAGYEEVFGALPDMSSWPTSGMPGDAVFDQLPEKDQDQINRIAANVGKALEAYQRKNSTSRAALDHFLTGTVDAMIPAARRGLEVFLNQRCDSCHSGPMLTDEKFYDMKFPSQPQAPIDLGRIEGLRILEQSVFKLSGLYADSAPIAKPGASNEVAAPGAFRTPSLRNVVRTAPYGHDGSLAGLRDVLALHAPNLTSDQQGDLLAFMQALNGDYPPPPWNNWPSPQ